MSYDVVSPKRRIWREILAAALDLQRRSQATLTDPRSDDMQRTIAQSNLDFATDQAARARAALQSEARP